jgi:hypothetical protein
MPYLLVPLHCLTYTFLILSIRSFFCLPHSSLRQASLGDEVLDLGMASKLLQEQITLQRLVIAQNAAVAAAAAPLAKQNAVSSASLGKVDDAGTGTKKKTGKRVSKKGSAGGGGVGVGGLGAVVGGAEVDMGGGVVGVSVPGAGGGSGKGLGIHKVLLPS